MRSYCAVNVGFGLVTKVHGRSKRPKQLETELSYCCVVRLEVPIAVADVVAEWLAVVGDVGQSAVEWPLLPSLGNYVVEWRLLRSLGNCTVVEFVVALEVVAVGWVLCFDCSCPHLRWNLEIP